MRRSVARYLGKCAALQCWPLVARERAGIRQVVAIPALAERDFLFDTLRDLARNNPAELERTLVVCVVNHRTSSRPEDIENNRETLCLLEGLVQQAPDDALRDLASSPLRVAYVDAASPGMELPEKGGVGLARKIGLDWGLAILGETEDDAPGLLLSLDADTRVEPSYLEAVRAHFRNAGAWAGTIRYAHPLDGPPETVRAIVCYELFLRYYVLGLQYAGSPYAFSSVGSTMVCTDDAYVAVSGMNQRQAGEDFYFLQELAKTGRVDSIDGTTVCPSARPSHRVPFGTGQRVRRFLEGTHDEYAAYAPRCFRTLKTWLEIVSSALRASADTILSEAETASWELRAFLEGQGFARVWPRLQANANDDARLVAQFHRWFDGFRTMKLIHHLRDREYGLGNLFESIACLMAWTEAPLLERIPSREDLDAQIAWLECLRAEGPAPRGCRDGLESDPSTGKGCRTFEPARGT